MAKPGDGLPGDAQHLEPARGVQRKQPDTRKTHRRSDRSGDSIWDVVEFQVKEDARRMLCDPADGLRAFRGEQPATDLEEAYVTFKTAGQGERVPQAVGIQGDD